MSMWTHTRGVLVINCFYGATQQYKDDIVDEIVRNAPKVTGSENDLEIQVVRALGDNGFCAEWFYDIQDQKEYQVTYYQQQRYTLILNGDYRDREYAQTKEEFEKLLDYLARRLDVDTCLVNLYADYRDPEVYTEKTKLFNGLTIEDINDYDADYEINAADELDFPEDEEYYQKVYDEWVENGGKNEQV